MAGERQPIKVVKLIARLNIGGPAIHTILLTRDLNDGAFSSLLVTGVVSPGEGDMIGYAREMGVNPLVLPELRNDVAPLRDLRAFLKVFSVLRRERPDIIHTHTAKAGLHGRAAGVVYNLWARLHGLQPAKLVHTFHGHVFHGYFSPLKSKALVLVERLMASFTHRIVAVSEKINDDLVHLYRVCPESKVEVVPVGLDFGWTRKLKDARGTLKREMGIPSDCLTVGIVGRLTAIKNHELFLQAARESRISEARFFVIGDGERRVELEELADRLGLNGRVVFTGWQRDPAKIYADLDIVCLTSINEGTPVALIEAMAAGVPVVATKVGGVPDLMVGEGALHPPGLEVFSNGILVTPDRPDVLGAALEFLAARPDVRQAMGAAGRSFVPERFSVERLVARMESLYLDLLASRCP